MFRGECAIRKIIFSFVLFFQIASYASEINPDQEPMDLEAMTQSVVSIAVDVRSKTEVKPVFLIVTAE